MKKLNRLLGGLALLAVSLGLAGVANASSAASKLTVVELFTSQGCNSCPPADLFLGELAKRDGILVLSWNVEYWDYLGWKDTLARPGNSDRQRAYNRHLGRPGVYTPEMVIQGMYQVPGSDRAAVEDKIATAQSKEGHHLDITVDKAPETLTVRVAANHEVAPEIPCDISLVKYEKAHTVPVHKGENRGEKLTYTNVVTGVERLGVWQGGVVELQIDKASLSREGNAILIQEGAGGPVLAAHVIDVN